MTIRKLDSEKITDFFYGREIDGIEEYVYEVFCDEEFEEELKHHLKRQWYELSTDQELDGKNLDKILYRIHYEINVKQHKFKRPISNFIKAFSKIACILILPLMIYSGINFFKTKNEKDISWVEIRAPAWTRVHFSLPDGTHGWLNSGSSVKYKGNFINSREVELIGEAYFDVKKDKKAPFVVNTNEVIVKVLGTRFNIAAYEDDPQIEVVLEEGKLVINNMKLTRSSVMDPNNLVTYNKNLDEFKTEMVDPQKHTSWKEGKLIFRNDPLKVIAERLERWYNIDVEIIGSYNTDIRLRATFVDESLNEVLYFLSRSLPITYKIENGSLISDSSYIKTKIMIFSKSK